MDDYLDLWTHPKNQTVECFIKPSVLELGCHQANNRGACTTRTPSFTVHEIARLCVLLTERDDIRRALITSGTDLSREPKDARQGRDEFWERLFAPPYSYETQKITVWFAGEVNDRAGGAIDANQRVPCLRSGAFSRIANSRYVPSSVLLS